MLQILRLIDLEVKGVEKFQDGAGRLIVANHPSLLDVVLLMALVRRAQCVVKKELWQRRAPERLTSDAKLEQDKSDGEGVQDGCR
jgi:hypothetical protein